MQLASVIIFVVIWELLALSALPPCPIIQVTAQQQGFVSIDCGGNTTSYTDPETTLSWTSDSTGFGIEKVSRVMAVEPPQMLQAWRWLSSVRIFEGTQSKYCYDFNGSYQIQPDYPYLVRASFWAGKTWPFSTPNRGQDIRFKLLVNANQWDDIAISFPQKEPLVKEVFVNAVNGRISVCVTGNSSEPAFMSAVEVRRPRDDRWPVFEEFMQFHNSTPARLIFLYARLDLGSSTGKDIRYPYDPNDRIWSADISTLTIPISEYGGTPLRTSSDIATDDYDEINGFHDSPPSVVLQTALTDNTSFNITFDNFSRSYDFVYRLFYAEISDDVHTSGERVFNEHTIGAFGVERSQENIDPYNPYNDGGVTGQYSGGLVAVEEGGFLTFNFIRNSTSKYGPLVSSLELQYASQGPMSLGTDPDEVWALDAIKKGLQGFDSWSGDPCLHIPYEWLTCDSEIPPHIIKLSLQKRNITAEIPPEIGSLHALVEIDLSGNHLIGSIPNSIAQLPNLKKLLLQDNNLSGQIPQALLEKEILFSVAGNPILCKDNNEDDCNNRQQQTKSNGDSKMHLVVILVSVFAAVVLILASISVFYSRRKGKLDSVIAITHEEVIKYSNLAQQFTSQQIERITNDFQTKLGAGGFGDVFLGTLSNGLDVAVKVSSHRNGAQEASEFLNEMAFLSRVHHKNLVEFVGYCIHPRLMLIYEYMAKGSLEDHLHGNVMVPLTWRDRLKIVVGAAQGLEYLHKGCKPPIIHRDVKCSNILLDVDLEGKISDFGISRSKLANTHMTVTHMQGTVGYIAPEYAELRITEKVDVFAFGVVLLQVVSGRRPFEGSQHIVNWVRPLINKNQIQRIVDPSIAITDYNISSMLKLLEIAMACVEYDTERRPDIHEVSSELNSVLSFELQSKAFEISYETNDLPFDNVSVSTR